MTIRTRRESVTLAAMRFPMADWADKGMLVGRSKGEEARGALERAITATGPDEPVAADFSGVGAISVPFAEGFFVPLLAGRLAGYHDEHPFLIVDASEDVSATIAAALKLHGLSVLGTFEGEGELLGGDPALREAMHIAYRRGQLSATELADELGISTQAANNRLNALFKRGALRRARVVPRGGGKEFRYVVPAPGMGGV
jgi:hypothetical protein